MRRSTIFYLAASAVVAYLYGFPTNGLSHFDEGQYAFARVWPWIDKFDVDQAFFSPPLYPFLVGLVQHLPISRTDLAGVYISHAACWASLYFGVKLAAAWWGEAAALPAYLLLLFSPMRLAFGSIGLTDALFSALLLATLVAATKAFHGGSMRWTVLTGLLAGSTWSCKYNGFVAVLIIAGFLLHQRTASSFVRWLTIGLTAALIMVPWFWAVHAHHPEGIAALQRHQQGYLRGFSFDVVWGNLKHGAGLRGEVPAPSVLLICWMIIAAAACASRSWLILSITALLLAVEECTTSKLLPILGLALAPFSVWASRPSARAPIVLAIAATVFLPAIYTPYLRLWLPAEHVLLLVISGAVASAGTSLASIQLKRPIIAIATLLLLVPSFIEVSGPAAYLLGVRTPEWLRNLQLGMRDVRQPMWRVDGYLMATQDFVERGKALGLRELKVYGRPPLLYYLANSDWRVELTRLPDNQLDLSRYPAGTYLLVDIAHRDSKQFAASLREAKRHRSLQRTNGWPVSPHPLTMLDDFGSLSAMDRGGYNLNLYLIAPFDGSGQ